MMEDKPPRPVQLDIRCIPGDGAAMAGLDAMPTIFGVKDNNPG